VIRAIKGVSFEVNEGEVIALVGANGAGKTTILHTISGLIPIDRGSVTFNGQKLNKVPAHKIVEMGIAQVPEGRRIFQQLTVWENLKLGAYTRKDSKEIAGSLEYAYSRFPRLKERKNQIAGRFRAEKQQMLAMAAL
jgi:branched-chain amino acid transport system ATP-binding protein